MIFIGKITGCHGIKGELKVLSDFERKDLVFRVGQKIYIQNELHEITSIRTHQNKELITIDHLNNINDVNIYRGLDIFVQREDIALKEDEFLMNDLLSFTVWESDYLLGEVINIMANKTQLLLKIKRDKIYYLPWQDYFIKKIDLVEKKIIVQNSKGLLYED